MIPSTHHPKAGSGAGGMPRRPSGHEQGAGLGEAEAKSLTSFQEVPDVGERWTLVVAYGGQEVHRQTLARTTLAAGNWRIVLPADATRPLGQAGFQ